VRPAREDRDFGLLEALFAHAPVGLALWDDQLRYRRVNLALTAMDGPAAEEHLGRTPEEVLGAGLGGEIARMLRQVLETGEALFDISISGATPARPGEMGHWRASYFPVEDGRRRVGVGAIVVEVTAEHRETARADLALRRASTASALLDAVFDAAPVGLGLWTSDARYERINDTLAAINGPSAEEHLGRTPEEVLGEVGVEIGALVRQVAATREPVLDREVVGQASHRPGFVQRRQSSYFPVLGPDGELVRVGGIVRDVTEEHEAAEERERLLRDALTARAQAQAAEVRADVARADAERARARVEFLSAAGARMLGAMSDYASTLREVVELAVPAVADWCAITLVGEGGSIEVPAVAHADPARERVLAEIFRRYPPRMDRPTGSVKVIRTGRLELIEEVTDEQLRANAVDEEHHLLLRRLGLRAVLIVPLRTPAGVLGALTFAMSESGRSFGPDDLALARGLAARAALALENARLYRERTHIARTLQRSLLPTRLPEVPGIDLAARYRPAGDHNEVGGDFYDVFPSEAGVWTAVTGDVVGKGPEAAALTSLARHTLRAAALRVQSPIENLALLNEALLGSQEVGPTRFCTVVYARLCPNSKGVLVTLANGGHVPPTVVRAGGDVDFVRVPGTLIGAFPDPALEQRDVQLGPGDALVLYTDGAVEIRGEDGDFGERQLVETLAAHAGGEAAELIEAVERAAVDSQGGNPRDDIALLAVRALPPERR
jgi:serine phosphatase RsbU (regulator of sigma subunit)/PAS domain-containing protein